jgi:hypothetical protein
MAANSHGNSASDGFIYIVTFLLLGLLATWLFNRYAPVVHEAVMRLSLAELAIPALFDGDAAEAREIILSCDPATTPTATVFRQLPYASRYWAWLAVIMVALLTKASWSLSPADAYRRKLSMKSLLANNAKTVPAIAPVMAWPKSLLEEPVDSGLWMVARQPLQFAAMHGLLVHAEDAGKRIAEQRIIPADMLLDADGMANPTSPILGAIPSPRAALSRGRTEAVFRAQFGPPFPGYILKIQPGYVRKLAVAFLLHGCDRKREAYALLDSMAASFRPPDPGRPPRITMRPPFFDPRKEGRKRHSFDMSIDLEGLAKRGCDVETLLARKDVERATKPHDAWLNLYVLALYAFARNQGVLPTADFIWLRPMNRTLFYLLNDYGRSVA